MTSFSAGFCSSNCFFTPPHRINDARSAENIDLFHIYIIARAPRVRLVPGSFDLNKGNPFVQYKAGHEFSTNLSRFYLPSEELVTDFVTTDGAGRSFAMQYRAGELRGDFPLFAMKYGRLPELLSHQVVYIGQAYGKDGQRSVIDRLMRHETLQKIVSENSIEAPETDIFVYGFQYTNNDQIFMMFNGADKNLISDSRDDERRVRVMNNPIDDRVMTQIVEAALIRYFEPIYNEKFRKIFPASHHKFLDGVKSLDYDGFVVEINTEDLGTRLFSSARSPGSHHTIKFKITKRSQHPIFSFYRLMKDTGLDPTSGPLF